MGIRNLHSFLRSTNQDLYKINSLQNYQYKTFAVDTSIYMCRYKSSMGNRWLQGFWLLISIMKKYNIDLIFVFDSKPPPEKNLERHLRSVQKEKSKQRVHNITNEFYEYKKKKIPFDTLPVFITEIEKSFPILHRYVKKNENNLNSEMDVFYLIQKLENSILRVHSSDFDLLKDFLRLFRIPFINAHSEAEGTCAFLNICKIADYVLTEDTDVLAYGCTSMLHSLKLKEECITEIKLNDILQNLDLEKKQFVDFCIMCGTDYNDNIPKLGPKTCYNLLQKNHNIEAIEKLEKYDITILNYNRVRTLFCFDDYKMEPICKDHSKPTRIQIQQFLFQNNIIYTKDDLDLFL